MHSTGAASRLAALLPGQMLSVFLVVAACTGRARHPAAGLTVVPNGTTTLGPGLRLGEESVESYRPARYSSRL